MSRTKSVCLACAKILLILLLSINATGQQNIKPNNESGLSAGKIFLAPAILPDIPFRLQDQSN
jgi:hypothetical protein